VPRNAHQLDLRSRLNAGDCTALCWPVLVRLMAAVLLSGLSTAADAACSS